MAKKKKKSKKSKKKSVSIPKSVRNASKTILKHLTKLKSLKKKESEALAKTNREINQLKRLV